MLKTQYGFELDFDLDQMLIAPYFTRKETKETEDSPDSPGKYSWPKWNKVFKDNHKLTRH